MLKQVLLVTMIIAMPVAAAVAQQAMPPADQALHQADDAMMKAMNVPMTGDPDKDFVAMMIPHHQGAVAMAEVEVQYGKDPEMRKMAKRIIAAQKIEVTRMQEWQKAHP